eukprot:CAMPEP_0113505342 /NCGR_PEP_ID=MMETSP0014_2-20120614/35259_1 /TAXON_ID=2857 /ORGANISM="Nitzschia sp." /LENGTH=89 /DNA_ID=CAMNT_0000400635 /DNA_START=322 /DNA_END=588 /DNA_ORIENTATION=+ /assembly_acc=CAM_ASM_000159
MGGSSSSIANTKIQSSILCSGRNVLDKAKTPTTTGTVDHMDRDGHDYKSTRESNKNNANAGVDEQTCGKNENDTPGESNRTTSYSDNNS